jgi:hypothetical protein
MATEEKLLNTLFDDASKDGERCNAISSLRKMLKLDREGLVKRYTAAATKAGSGTDTTARVIDLRFEIAGLELKIEKLELQHREDLRRREQMETLLVQGHRAEMERITKEYNRLRTELDHARIELSIMKSPTFPEIKCAAPGCAKMFRPHRRDHTTCSDTCRKALSRARKREAIRPPDAREA